MAVGDARIFRGFLTPVLTQLFFPKPPTTFLTRFCTGERRKYGGKKVRLNRGSNSQRPYIESGINYFAADNTSLSMVVGTPVVSGAILQSDIEKIGKWADRWLVQCNPSKCKSLITSSKQIKPIHPDQSLSNVVIPSVQFHKHLGICLSCDGTWEHQIQAVVYKAWKRIVILRSFKYNIDRLSLLFH